MLDVFGIQADNFLKIRDIGAAADLPETGDAGFDGEAGSVVVFIFLPFIHRRRTCADQRHLPCEHVEKLGKFIQAVFADELADPRHLFAIDDPVPDDAGIEIQLEHHPVRDAVLGKEFFLPLLRIHVHGADLVAGEVLAIPPDAFLFEKDRARRLMFDDRAENGHQDECGDAAEEAANDIHNTLDRQLQR